MKTAAVAVAVLAAACSRDPRAPFARTLDKAASWSAAVQMASGQARAGAAPRPYMHDLLTTAAGDLDQLARDIEKTDDVDGRVRTVAAESSRRLAALLRDADRRGDVPDQRTLRTFEQQLRSSAQMMRTNAAPPQAP